MKKRILSIITVLVLCLSLLPTAAFAEETDEHSITLNWSGPCEQANTTETFDIAAQLPDNAIITGHNVGTCPLISDVTTEWSESTNTYKLAFTTKVQEEPASGQVVVMVGTQSHGTYTITINIVLTGKYKVTISGVTAMDAVYDGYPHAGYNGTPVGTLTNESAYTGDYVYTYAKKDGTPLTSAPTEVGAYTVTIAVPESNGNYKGSTTLNFKIISDAEAAYQTEEGGSWLYGAFTQALADVYEGGTVKLLKDVDLSSAAAAAKAMTITSDDAESPCKITSKTDAHGYLLHIDGDVTMTDVIVDGGSEANITAQRAAVLVNGGTLTLGEGAVIRNNNHTPSEDSGKSSGGGIAIADGSLILNGGQVTGNKASHGAGVYLQEGNVSIISGEISGNYADSTKHGGYGGGLYMTDKGSICMTGGKITGNKAAEKKIGSNTYGGLGGGVFMFGNASWENGRLVTTGGSFTMNGGEISGNTAGIAGGAVDVNGGSFTMNDGEISGNTAADRAGGICVYGAEYKEDNRVLDVYGASLAVSGGKITGNSAPTGGGIFIEPYASLELKGGTVSGNQATYYAGGINCAYGSVVTISGSPVVKGNTSGEESSGGIYPDGNPYNGYADIKLGQLSSDADINFYTWAQSGGFLIASPAAGYTITAADVSKMNYINDSAHSFSLKLNEDGNVVLTTDAVCFVTFDANGGSLETAVAQVVDGSFSPALTELPTPTRSGSYRFDGWFTEKNGGETVTTDTAFSSDMTIYAHWTYTGGSGGSYTPTYPITVDDAADGSAAADYKSAAKGTTVTITPKPTMGYQVSGVKVLDKDGNPVEVKKNTDGTYSFIQPASKVTVQVTYVPADAGFIDVPADAYYAEAVNWAAAEGITGGVGNNQFAPDLACTRAQIVTFLWRAAGSPAPKTVRVFSDVPADAYYAKAVYWAAENGITGGVGDNKFAPDLPCTRAQAVTFLFRYAASQGMDAVTLQELVSGYGDAEQVPGYALSAFNWALANGNVQGYNGNLMPNDDCTRAQIVTFLYRSRQ